MSKFATKSPKASCFSVVDNHGKTNVALTYSKWPALLKAFPSALKFHWKMRRPSG